jgi:hypothetical protein
MPFVLVGGICLRAAARCEKGFPASVPSFNYFTFPPRNLRW